MRVAHPQGTSTNFSNMLIFRLDSKTLEMSIDEQFLVSSSGSWERNEDAILGEMLLPGNPNVPGRASFYLPPPTVWKPQTLKTKELCVSIMRLSTNKGL